MVVAATCKAERSSGFNSQLSLFELGSGTLGVCGMTMDAAATFFISREGHARAAPEVFAELPAIKRYGLPVALMDAEGADLDSLDISIANLMTRADMTQRFRRRRGAWTRQPDDAPRTGPVAVVDGRSLRDVPGEKGFAFQYDDGKPGWLPARGGSEGCAIEQYEALHVIDGVLWGFGSGGRCERLVAQRWTVGTSETKSFELSGLPVARYAYGSIQPIGAGRWFFRGGARLGIKDGIHTAAWFDGKAWQPVKALSEEWPRFGDPSVVGEQAYFLDGEDGLRRFDGGAFVRVPMPAAARHAVASPNELRIVTDKGVFSMDEDGTWHELELPIALADDEFSLSFSRGRWLAISSNEDSVRVLVEGASGPPLSLADTHPMQSPIALVRPLLGRCNKPFALLYQLTKAAPADFNYPATRAALKGQPSFTRARFSEVHALGSRYLIARFAGSEARSALTDLARHLEREVKGSKPQLLCADALAAELPVARDLSMY